MIRTLLTFLLAATIMPAAMQPVAARSPDEVQALVERAARYVHDHGLQQALADFSRPDGGFVDGELYIFCIDATGLQVANGANPKLVGKNTFAVRDAEGIRPSFELYRIGQTQGHGWFQYHWPNLAEGRIQRKTSYVLRIDDQTVCGSGYFEPIAP